MPKRRSLRDHPLRHRRAPVGREAIYAPSSIGSEAAEPVAHPRTAPLSPPIGLEPASPIPQETVAAAPPVERETKEPTPPLAPVEPTTTPDLAVAGPYPPAAESPPAPGPPPEEVVIVLRCTRCGAENSVDSVYCRVCGEFIRQWGAVLVKSTSPISMSFKLGPGRPGVVIRRHFSVKTSVEVTLQISGGARQDVIAYVRSPSKTTVAGSQTRRIRRVGRLAWQVTEPGEYRVVIDNSFSTFSSKMVQVTLSGF